MADILVDSNVILDVVTEDPKWYEWSSAQLEKLAESHNLFPETRTYFSLTSRCH